MKKVLKVLGIIVVFFVVASLGYLMTGQNKAYQSDIDLLSESATYQDNYYKVDHNSENGFILYPGAKVDPEAYAYLASLENTNVYIVDFPFNFAFFSPNKADEIIENEPEVNNWYIGGHSLGGVFAYNYAKNNTDLITGVVFLASYPAEQIPSDSPLEILSIYGLNDGVVGDYSEKLSLFNDDTVFVPIEGANHTQNANYDLQKGDNEATISVEEQHDITIKSIEGFIDGENN